MYTHFYTFFSNYKECFLYSHSYNYLSWLLGHHVNIGTMLPGQDTILLDWDTILMDQDTILLDQDTMPSGRDAEVDLHKDSKITVYL